MPARKKSRSPKRRSPKKRSPKSPSSKLAFGTKRQGRDGKMYQVAPTASGGKRWQRCAGACSGGRKRSRPLGPKMPKRFL